MRGFDFERIFLVEVAQLDEILVAIERVIVEVHFGVERDQPAVAGDDQRIDFRERRVGFDERAIERLQETARRPGLLGAEAQAESELARD